MVLMTVVQLLWMVRSTEGERLHKCLPERLSLVVQVCFIERVVDLIQVMQKPQLDCCGVIRRVRS